MLWSHHDILRSHHEPFVQVKRRARFTGGSIEIGAIDGANSAVKFASTAICLHNDEGSFDKMAQPSVS